MKNFGKILAVVIALSMLLSVVGYASFTDVKDTDPYAEAVSVLSSLGIIVGYPDGTFGPEKSITRAEFAAVVDRIKALGDSADAAKGKTQFTDVKEDHWATGYINLATQQGIVNGMGDGTFAPDANVTFAQSVKMIVAALGYTPMATSMGGWPSGYLAVGAQKGVTKGVTATKDSEAATRGTVAIMLYNALDIPLMEQTGFGTDVKFEAGNKLLLDGLDVIKVEGWVTATKFSEGSATFKNNEVKFDTDRQYYATDKGKLDYTTTDFDIADPETVLVGNTNAKDLLDYYVVAYIKNVDDKPEFAAIAAKKGKNSTLSIKSSDLKYTDTAIVDGNTDVGYYLDKENSKDDTVTIDSNATYYYNGSTTSNKRPDGTAGTAKELFQDAVLTNDNLQGTIVLLNNDTDDNYDVVYVTEYADYIVDDINANSYKIYDETSADNKSIILDITNKDYDITFEKDGKPAKFSDIKEGNVLSVCGKVNADMELEFGKVIIVDKNVTGTIGEVRSADDEVVIGDKTYEYTVADSDLKVGKDGLFYVNADGKIIAIDDNQSSDTVKLAYVSRIVKSSGLESAYQVKALLPTSTDWKVFNVAEKVTVNEAANAVDPETVDWAAAASADGVNAFQGDAAGQDADTTYVYQLVSYMVNAAGEIKEIDFVPGSNDTVDFWTKAVTAKVYDANIKKFAGVSVSVKDSTVIFEEPTATQRGSLANARLIKESDINVSKPDVLIDNHTYTGNAYNMNSSDEATVIVGSGFTGFINYADNFMVVDSISEVMNTAGGTVDKVTGYVKDSTKVSLVVDENYSLPALAKGDVIMFSKNLKGELKTVQVLLDISTVAGAAQVNNTAATVTRFDSTTLPGYTVGDDIFKYAVGYAFKKDSSKYTFTVNDTTGNTDANYAADKAADYSFASGATVIEYDAYYPDGRVRVVDSSFIDADKDLTDGVKGDYVFFKINDSDRITQAVIIKHYKPNN